MRLQEKKNSMPLFRQISVLAFLPIVCLSMTIVWRGTLEAQMSPRQFLQRDETTLQSKPAPTPQAAPAPAPAPVIIQQVPAPARVSDYEVEQLRKAIQDLTQQVKELKSQIKKNKGEPQAPPKGQ